MHNREIQVFNLASTAPNYAGMRKWLDCLGATDYTNHEQAGERESIVGVAAKRCYNAFEPGMNPNVTKVRNDWVLYFDNILQSGHGSVLEHASYSFAIENVTRVFTAEMNRHRAGVAISEASMRYIRFDDIPFWMPMSIRGEDTEFGKQYMADIWNALNGMTLEIPDGLDLEDKKTVTRELFKHAFEQIQEIYKVLVTLWLEDESVPFSEKKKITSCLRRIVPMGVCTGGVWTFNLRALRHVIALRSTEHAEEEIALVVGLIMKDLAEKEPNLFGDFEEVDGFWKPKYPKV
jgi:thymidylate synthase (FAD)